LEAAAVVKARGAPGEGVAKAGEVAEVRVGAAAVAVEGATVVDICAI
jgi:hypothetical protein